MHDVQEGSVMVQRHAVDQKDEISRTGNVGIMMGRIKHREDAWCSSWRSKPFLGPAKGLRGAK